MQTGTLLKPDKELRTTAETLLQNFRPTADERPAFQNRVWQLLAECRQHNEYYRWEHPGEDQDFLFETEYICADSGRCPEMCDSAHLVRRSARPNKLLKLHGGLIASTGSVIKRAAKRDELVKSCKQGRILCFEMEAVAIASEQRVLTVKGICDYSDSHKNKRWQPYAAVAAAAFAKSVILGLDPLQSPPSPVSNDLRRISTLKSWYSGPSESPRDDLVRRQTEPFVAEPTGLGILGRPLERESLSFREKSRRSLTASEETPDPKRRKESLRTARSSSEAGLFEVKSEKDPVLQESLDSDFTPSGLNALPNR